MTRQKWPDRLVTGLEGAQVCLAPHTRTRCTQRVSRAQRPNSATATHHLTNPALSKRCICMCKILQQCTGPEGREKEEERGSHL